MESVLIGFDLKKIAPKTSTMFNSLTMQLYFECLIC